MPSCDATTDFASDSFACPTSASGLSAHPASSTATSTTYAAVAPIVLPVFMSILRIAIACSEGYLSPNLCMMS